MGGSAPSASTNYSHMLQAMIKYLPDLANVTASVQPTVDAAAIKSAQQLTPAISQTGLENLQQYGLPYAEAGQAINKSNALAQAATDLAVLQGSGADLAKTAKAISQEVNPEYYKTRATESQKIDDLLNSIDLTGLSGSERAEVERSLNRSNAATGNLGIDNATTAVSNAMTFGKELQTKRDALSDALNTSTQFLQQANTNFDPVQTALGRSSTSNPGTNQYTGVQSSSGANNTLASNALNSASNIWGNNMQYQWASQSANSPAGIAGAVTSGIGNICCFIFLESYNGKLPWWVRECRDYYYRRYPEMAVGYRRMAKWLVPLMQRYSTVRRAVNTLMVTPLTRYGGYLYDITGYENCGKYRHYFTFWSFVWRKLAC